MARSSFCLNFKDRKCFLYNWPLDFTTRIIKTKDKTLIKHKNILFAHFIYILSYILKIFLTYALEDGIVGWGNGKTSITLACWLQTWSTSYLDWAGECVRFIFVLTFFQSYGDEGNDFQGANNVPHPNNYTSTGHFPSIPSVNRESKKKKTWLKVKQNWSSSWPKTMPIVSRVASTAWYRHSLTGRNIFWILGLVP